MQEKILKFSFFRFFRGYDMPLLTLFCKIRMTNIEKICVFQKKSVILHRF